MKDLTKEQVIKLFKENWKPIGLSCIILLFLLITLLLPGEDKKPQQVNPDGTKSANSTNSGNNKPKKSSNPFSFLFSPKKNDPDTEQSSPVGVTPPPNSTNTQAASTITKVEPNGTTTSQKISTNSIISTTQGTINLNSNIASDLTSNTEVDNIRIVFQNPDGSTFTYIPPGTPPDEVRWGRYTNNTTKYAINYPSNWQFVYSVSDGNEGVALFPPGVSVSDPRSPFIGFGIADNFLLPAEGEGSNSQIIPILVDGVNGNLYTNGPLGSSRIASVMPYNSNYFGLGASKSDATFAYVYYYMINSLTFNIE